MKLILENWNKFINEAQGDNPKLIFLIGPPAVGKSTWIKTNPNIVGDHVILNRDDLVEKVAAESNIGTYDAMYVRPKISAPKGMPSREQLEQYSSDPEIKKIVDTYIESLKIPVADYNTKNPEMAAQYGAIEGFDAETLIKIATEYGVPTQHITPFFFPSIEEAGQRVDNELQKAREDAVGQKKNIVVDMTSMSGRERNLHRKQIAAVITKNPEIDDKAALEQINKDFIQEAYVFAPDESGYENEELKEKIKQIGAKRAGEIATEPIDPQDPAGPKRSKTIPDRAYDVMFDKYEPPNSGEGFGTRIMYVGVPSLAKLKR